MEAGQKKKRRGINMIIRNGAVFQEDGSFVVQDVYVENHKIVAEESLVTDRTEVDASGLMVLPGLVDGTVTGRQATIFQTVTQKG